METHKACRLTGQMSKLPCLGACCLDTAYPSCIIFFLVVVSFSHFSLPAQSHGLNKADSAASKCAHAEQIL